MTTKTIIARQPNGNVSITYYDDRDDFDSIVKKHVTDQGHVHIKTVDGIVDKPSDRADRDCWDFDGNKVHVHPVKKAEKFAREQARQAVLAKLGITEEEFDKIRKK